MKQELAPNDGLRGKDTLLSFTTGSGTPCLFNVTGVNIGHGGDGGNNLGVGKDVGFNTNEDNLFIRFVKLKPEVSVGNVGSNCNPWDVLVFTVEDAFKSHGEPDKTLGVIVEAQGEDIICAFKTWPGIVLTPEGGTELHGELDKTVGECTFELVDEAQGDNVLIWPEIVAVFVVGDDGTIFDADEVFVVGKDNKDWIRLFKTAW